MSNNTVNAILESLEDFSDEDLERLWRGVHAYSKEKFRQTSALRANLFTPGDKVVNIKGTNRLPINTEGRVERIGRSKVAVDFGIYRVWNVPAQWIKHVHATAKAKA